MKKLLGWKPGERKDLEGKVFRLYGRPCLFTCKDGKFYYYHFIMRVWRLHSINLINPKTLWYLLRRQINAPYHGVFDYAPIQLDEPYSGIRKYIAFL